MNRAAVIIAVKKAGNLPELEGATSGAKAFADWAREAKFKTVKLITDEKKAVTISRIKRAIKRIVKKDNCHQLFVYFAGHGLNVRYSEFWLLSDVPEDLNEAVNVSATIVAAKRSRIPHVILISDACRDYPTRQEYGDLNGGVIFPGEAATGRQGGAHQFVDIFYATGLGEAANEIKTSKKAKGNFKSLFTEEFLSALKGKRTHILSNGAAQEKLVYLRPHPLKRHLAAEVPKLFVKQLGNNSGIKQVPDADILSDEFAFIHLFKREKIPVPMKMPGFAGATHGRKLESSISKKQSRPEESELSKILLKAEVQSRNKKRVSGATRFKMAKRRAKTFTFAEENTAKLNLTGTTIREIQIENGGVLKHAAESGCEIDLSGKAAVNILIRLANERVLVVPVIRGYLAQLVIEGQQLRNVHYEPLSGSQRGRQLSTDRAKLRSLRTQIAKYVQKGMFKLNALDVPVLVRQMRYFKSIDPTLALYAAYTFHRLGNTASIREMSTVLFRDVGMQFFDLDLMSDTPKRHKPILPNFPLMAQGWSFLEVFRRETQLTKRLRKYVCKNSLWTIFEDAAWEILRKHL